jgi:hypothetical protein
LLAPLVLQAAAMAIDELHFHRRRGLGRWERVGHPLDTMTFLACIVWTLAVPPTGRALIGYLVLAAFSCLFVTKDEPVHARRCTAGEQWLHALLFVLHPISLACLGLLWPSVHGRQLIEGTNTIARAVPGQLLMTSAFCIYQILYWNIPWPRRAPPT